MSGRAHRLFCAIFPPPEAADSLRSLLTDRALPAHRSVPADQVHVTVQFIGDTRGSELAKVEESVRRAASGVRSFVLQPTRLRSLPERGTARLLAVETDAPPSLEELHRRMVSRLARNSPGKVDGFMPHLTLCRFSGPGARGLVVDDAVSVAPFVVDHVAIMESVLHSTGAEYRRLASVTLERELGVH